MDAVLDDHRNAPIAEDRKALLTLIEMKGHDHDYYSFAKSVNERAWSFLRSQALAQPQKFTFYANM